MNNYYRVGGQECKDTIFRHICEEQLCSTVALTYIYILNLPNMHPITLNLCYSPKYYRMLKTAIVPLELPSLASLSK